MLHQLIAPETAGNPMSAQKWLRSSLTNLKQRLAEVGHKLSEPTIARLLKKAQYSLRLNVKKKEASASHPDRNLQFEYIESQKHDFFLAELPVISVDSKKKELIGNFKNAGAAWVDQPDYVNVHDFLQEALGKAVPYGIYDLAHKTGSIYVGQSSDTAEFAVDALVKWWLQSGQYAYPKGQHLLILADGGGSNGYRSHLWKQQIQTKLCDKLALNVTVCHYPTGCSKWNPIEHRLFGPISLNWAGKPLRSWDLLLNYLRGTTTKSGLKVNAELLSGEYTKGQKVSPQAYKELALERHEVCPEWNYTLMPRLFSTGLSLASVEHNREVVS